MIITFQNHLENEKYFKRYVKGARLNRGRKISSKSITNFNSTSNPLNISLNIQGTKKYIVNIRQKENDSFLIIHDCPDFKKGYDFCKHIVKTLLILEGETCKKICSNRAKITFSSKVAKIKESKKRTFQIKAEQYQNEGNYLEAINNYELAYKEVKNANFLKNIITIGISSELPLYSLKYIAKTKKYVEEYKKELPSLIKFLITQKNTNIIPFSKFIQALFNIRVIFNFLTEVDLKQVLEHVNFKNLKNPIFEFIMLQEVHSKKRINIFTYSQNRAIKGLHQIKELKQLIETKTIDALNEALLNMDSEDVINAYVTILKTCNLSYGTKIQEKIKNYKSSTERIYRTALQQKHASLRNLLISNLNTDTLHPLSFNYNYRFRSLLWTNAKKDASPLYYYILDKCGLRKENLNYIKIEDFVENYPIFKNIFKANNPVPDRVDEFWKDDNYCIKNIIQQELQEDIDFDINLGSMNEYIIIEWDVAQKPILGSFLYQFDQGFIILEKNNPFTYEIKPFDLILCLKKPIEIKTNNIKIYRPLRRVSVRNAINLVYRGMDFISTYTPLPLVKQLKDRQIDEIDAINQMNDNFKGMFFPEKDTFKKEFQHFLKTQIAQDYNQFYLDLIKKKDYKNKVLNLIGFHRFQKIFTQKSPLKAFKKRSLKEKSLTQLKHELKKYISQELIELIKTKKYSHINLEILKQFPEFTKWTKKIIFDLKQELLTCRLIQNEENLINLSELASSQYGRIIIQESNVDLIKDSKGGKKSTYLINPKELDKIYECFSYLNLEKPTLIKESSQ